MFLIIHNSKMQAASVRYAAFNAHLHTVKASAYKDDVNLKFFFTSAASGAYYHNNYSCVKLIQRMFPDIWHRATDRFTSRRSVQLVSFFK
jgi:hypothetical protein